MVGISAWRKIIYCLIWQWVMWRPGKLRFLIGVKNPLPIDRPRPPKNTAPCGAPPVARFATPVGLPPPFVAHPATLPHPDRRALLILFAAQHRFRRGPDRRPFRDLGSTALQWKKFLNVI